MLFAKIEWPRHEWTPGVKLYRDYNHLEPDLERFVERHADMGWEVIEQGGSNSKEGIITLVDPSDDEFIIFSWKTKAD
jgi:hypothetical protein